MVGGPSHLDTFDPKPTLVQQTGKQFSFPGASGAQSQKTSGQLKGAPWKFPRCGHSGIPVSELFPYLAQRIDDIALLRGTVADSAAHGSASLQMNTGMIRQGFPSLGSWATYGLGSLNQNMPGFVVLVNGAPYSGALNWSSGFMPAAYQGTVFNTTGDPILNLRSAAGASLEKQRKQIDLINQFNQLNRAAEPDNTELSARIANYELAYRMQTHAPDVVNTADESPATQSLYGIGQPHTDKFGKSCLMARRLVERGVRFVELFHSNWDTHSDNDKRHKELCTEIDKPIAGLLTDLKNKGLLDETLIVWAGEFGRTPFGTTGRDHHASGFSTWMAGGGIKGGTAHGETDEYGFYVANGKTHVHDLHATILHLMGMNHEHLTYFHAGRNYRLTDVSGQVITPILA
jgi:membrane-anchored protein YejM (alkaline phosphatase superfamily)